MDPILVIFAVRKLGYLYYVKYDPNTGHFIVNLPISRHFEIITMSLSSYYTYLFNPFNATNSA